MASFSACRTPLQNFSPGSNDKLAGTASTDGNNPQNVSHAPNSTTVIALPFDVVLSSMAKYSENDL